MQRRLIFGILAAGFAACSSQSSPIPPAANPGFPVTGTYSYTTSQWGVVRPAHRRPEPVPTASSSENETVKLGSSFAGQNGLIEVLHSGNGTHVIAKNDDYLAWRASTSGRQALQRIGSTSYDKSAPGAAFGYEDSAQTIFSSPAIEVEFPFSNGTQWNAATSYRSQLAGHASHQGKTVPMRLQEIWNQDGSYALKTLNYPIIIWVSNRKPPNTVNLEDVASDGSASLKVLENGKLALSSVIGVPARKAGTFVIPVTTNGNTVDVSDWYPGGGLPPSPLVRATATDRGMVKLPRECRVPHSIATSAEAIATTRSQLNPLGIVAERTDVAYYASGIGLVCRTSVENAADYFVGPVAVRFLGRTTAFIVTSLTAAKVSPGFARDAVVTSAIENASAAGVAESADQRMKALGDQLRHELVSKGAP